MIVFELKMNVIYQPEEKILHIEIQNKDGTCIDVERYFIKELIKEEK